MKILFYHTKNSLLRESSAIGEDGSKGFGCVSFVQSLFELQTKPQPMYCTSNQITLCHIVLAGWNNLSGTLPHELSEFSESLVEFNIGGGSISGHIPRSFEQLTNLKSFACNDNCLTGVIPDLSDAIKLEKLWLSNNDGLSGSLNNFCSGPDILAPMSEVLADCRGSVECDCCNCCNQDVFECCLPDGTCQSSINMNALTPNNVLSSFDKKCLSENSKQWVQDECPCFYNKYNATTEEDDVGFQAVCTTDCNADGASPSYDF